MAPDEPISERVDLEVSACTVTESHEQVETIIAKPLWHPQLNIENSILSKQQKESIRQL